MEFNFGKVFMYAVKRDIYAEEESAITRMLQAVAVPVLGNVCHVFMHGLNRVHVFQLSWMNFILLILLLLLLVKN